MPIVSVIIPTYNRPLEIRHAVDVVLSQTFTDLELIVVDDCSPVPVADVLMGVNDKRLIVIRNAVNSKLSRTRNEGIEKAQGEWIAFIDDDDSWLPKKLERQFAFMKENAPDAEVCVTNYLDASTGRHHRSAEAVRKKGLARTLAHWEGIPPSSWLVKRTVFDRIGLFDPEAVRTEDWDWLLRYYMKGGKIACVPEELMIYDGIHPDKTIRTPIYIERLVNKHRQALRQVAGYGSSLFLDIFLHQKFVRSLKNTCEFAALAKHLSLLLGYLTLSFAFSPIETLKYLSETVENRLPRSRS